MENEIRLEDVVVPNQMDIHWNSFLARIKKLLYPNADAVFLEYDIKTDCYVLVPIENGAELWHIHLPVVNLLDLMFYN